jgi:hypothetical protein
LIKTEKSKKYENINILVDVKYPCKGRRIFSHHGGSKDV